MHDNIARPMPDGRKARWPARSGLRWQVRAATANTIVDDPFLNAEGRKDAMPDDIRRALRILVAACALEFAVYAALSLL